MVLTVYDSFFMRKFDFFEKTAKISFWQNWQNEEDLLVALISANST